MKGHLCLVMRGSRKAWGTQIPQVEEKRPSAWDDQASGWGSREETGDLEWRSNCIDGGDKFWGPKGTDVTSSWMADWKRNTGFLYWGWQGARGIFSEAWRNNPSFGLTVHPSHDSKEQTPDPNTSYLGWFPIPPRPPGLAKGLARCRCQEVLSTGWIIECVRLVLNWRRGGGRLTPSEAWWLHLTFVQHISRILGTTGQEAR